MSYEIKHVDQTSTLNRGQFCCKKKRGQFHLMKLFLSVLFLKILPHIITNVYVTSLMAGEVRLTPPYAWVHGMLDGVIFLL
jgi:hypothetical protein